MSARDKKKRNHYVPRLVLRNFSPDGRTIAVLVLSSGRRIRGASLRDQCYVDYFYGRDSKVENEFMAQEGGIASLLMPIDVARLERLGTAELTQIRNFVFQQRQRTVAAAQELHDSNAAMMGWALENGVRISEEEVRAFEEEQRTSQRFALKTAVEWSSIISDLEVKFLVPPRHGLDRPSRAFVISDAAVASYNQWAEHHAKFHWYTGFQGFACKGLQWFYPFAPDLCICVYDPTTYLYGSSNRRVCTASVRDVRFLNALQAIHGVHCIYYLPNRTHDEELDALREARGSHEHLRQPIRIEGAVLPRPDGTSSQIVGFTRRDARLGAQFQFVRVIDTSAYEHYDRAMLPPRSLELFRAASERLGAAVKRGSPDRAPEREM